MKHNKTKKIIVILSSIAVLVCALCTTTFASWSVATQGAPGNIPRVLDIKMNNNLNIALDTSFDYDERTYSGQILIEDLGNTFFNLANLEHSNTHSSEMEYLFAFTNIGAVTNRVGYSFYQSGMLNYDTTKFTPTYDGYSGVATTVYGFPKYTYDDHSVRITSIQSGEYFASASAIGFGNQNIRIYFPSVYSYNQLFQEVRGENTNITTATLRVNHYYSIDGYLDNENGTFDRTNKLYNYTQYVELPRYENLPTAYEPTTATTMPYITFAVQAPWSSIKGFCEREFDRYIFGSTLHIKNHQIQFSSNSVGVGAVQPDLADTLLYITDNNAYGGSRIPDRVTPYLTNLGTEYRPAIQDIDFGTWIGNAVQGFFNVEILPSFTFLDIYVAGISVLLLVAFLKMFAGG